MPSHWTSNAFEIAPRNDAFDDRVERREERRRLRLEDAHHRQAEAPRTGRSRSTRGSRSGSCWRERRSATTRRRRRPARAGTARTSWRTCRWRSCARRGSAAGPPVASECASATGAAHPASSSFSIFSKRFSFSVGFAIVSPPGSWQCGPVQSTGRSRHEEPHVAFTDESAPRRRAGGTAGVRRGVRVGSADESAGRRTDAARPRPGGRLRGPVRAADRPPRPRGARLQRDRAPRDAGGRDAGEARRRR